MANGIKIKDLTTASTVNDTDITILEDTTVTHKISISALINYITEKLKSVFISKTDINKVNGVSGLDSNGKIDVNSLTYGLEKNTVFEGIQGKTLQDNLQSHKTDVANPHKVTKEQVGLGNVENKSASTILSEMTSANVTTALGFTPETDGAYENATAYTDKKISDLIASAPETLNTLKEIDDEISKNKDIVTALNTAVGTKANQTELDTHTGNSTVHITSTERSNWNSAYTHSQATHARTDATADTASDTNGYIKINGTDTPVYQHPLSGITAGNYRLVTVDSQGHVTKGSNPTLGINGGGTGATTVQGVLDNFGITSSVEELNKLDGSTVTTQELNYVHGVKSDIQTQLDGKAPTNHGTHLPIITSDTAGKFAKSDGSALAWENLTKQDVTNALGYEAGVGNNMYVSVKGDAETDYRVGKVNITKANIGLGNVDNTKDSEKSVLSASKLATGVNIELAGDVISNLVPFDGTENVAINTHISSGYMMGGTNLLDFTKDFYGWENITSVSSEKYLDFTVVECSGLSPYKSIYLDEGDYTLSYYMKTKSTDNIVIGASIDKNHTFIGTKESRQNSGYWLRLCSCFYIENAGTYPIALIAKKASDESISASYYCCGFKLEHENIATDWSPSVNDLGSLGNSEPKVLNYTLTAGNSSNSYHKMIKFIEQTDISKIFSYKMDMFITNSNGITNKYYIEYSSTVNNPYDNGKSIYTVSSEIIPINYGMYRSKDITNNKSKGINMMIIDDTESYNIKLVIYDSTNCTFLNSPQIGVVDFSSSDSETTILSIYKNFGLDMVEKYISVSSFLFDANYLRINSTYISDLINSSQLGNGGDTNNYVYKSIRSLCDSAGKNIRDTYATSLGLETSFLNNKNYKKISIVSPSGTNLSTVSLDYSSYDVSATEPTDQLVGDHWYTDVVDS